MYVYMYLYMCMCMCIYMYVYVWMGGTTYHTATLRSHMTLLHIRRCHRRNLALGDAFGVPPAIKFMPTTATPVVCVCVCVCVFVRASARASYSLYAFTEQRLRSNATHERGLPTSISKQSYWLRVK